MSAMTSLFGGKTTSKSASVPYSHARKYIVGQEGEPGVFEQSADIYNQGGFTPEMQGAQQNYLQQLQGRSNAIPGADQFAIPRADQFAIPNADQFSLSNAPQIPQNTGVQNWLNTAAGDLGNAAYGVASGSFDSKFNPVANISAQNVSLQKARQGQGQLDPTRSLSGLLSGNVTNPYLQQQANAMTQNLTRNLNENVMPGLRSEALASGMYGGSRQGIAEGLAASRLNQDLAPALTNLFGGAFENAQNRMYGTATGLNDQAAQNATQNANRQMEANQFNANLGLQNNQQLMNQNITNLNNRMRGLDIAQGGLGLLQGGQQLRANELGMMQGQQQLQAGQQGLRSNEMGLMGQQQGLQQGAQGLQQGQQKLQAGQMGLQQGQYGMQDQNFAQQMAAYGMPQDVNWSNLNNYKNVIFPGAQLGGTQWGSNSTPMGIVPAALGTVSTIAGLGKGAGMFGGQASESGGGSSGGMDLAKLMAFL